MNVVRWKDGVDTTRKVYQCDSCGAMFNWSKHSVWYGSYKQRDSNPNEIKYYCSEKCIPPTPEQP